MAYATANLSMMKEIVDGSFRLWYYRSADAIATVRFVGYISDAGAKGMNVNDLVLVQDTATPTTQWCLVKAITAGAADLSDGTVIVQTNTD